MGECIIVVSLSRCAVVFLQHQGVKVCFWYAAQIDRISKRAIRFLAGGKGLNAAILTELMLDLVFIELVRSQLITAAVQFKLIGGHKGQE